MTARRITRADAEWPAALNELGPGAPEALFLDGDALPGHTGCVAIVGTRRPTSTGAEVAAAFACALVQAGFTVVSGFAVGIDAAAHRAALDAGGRTIAVIGCGLDVDYPRRHRTLRAAVVRSGTLVSEYEAGTEPYPSNFPARNRIIAGLCLATVVVEGSVRSGALITARHALDANRQVFAVPGSARNPMAAGPNELIRTGQAALVTSPEHLFEEIAPQLAWRDPASDAPVLDEGETAVLAAFEDVPAPVDALVARTGLAPGALALVLARLEVRGLVRRLTAGYERMGRHQMRVQ